MQININLTRKHILIATATLASITAIWLFISGKQSRELDESNADRAHYQHQCQKWVEDEFSKSGKAILEKSYERHGHIVFDFFAPEYSDSDTGFEVLCVVDPNTGMMSKPGAFEISHWR